MPFPRHFLLLLVQVVWPIHQRRAHSINPCSLQASTNNVLAAQGHFTPIGKTHSRDWAAAEQVVCRRRWARTQVTKAKQGTHRSSEYRSGASAVTPLVFRGPPHTSLWLPQLPLGQGGWEDVSRLVSQWLTVGFLSPDFRCPPGVS